MFSTAAIRLGCFRQFYTIFLAHQLWSFSLLPSLKPAWPWKIGLPRRKVYSPNHHVPQSVKASGFSDEFSVLPGEFISSQVAAICWLFGSKSGWAGTTLALGSSDALAVLHQWLSVFSWRKRNNTHWVKFGHKTPETNMKPVFFPLWGGFKRMSSGDIQHAPDSWRKLNFTVGFCGHRMGVLYYYSSEVDCLIRLFNLPSWGMN